MIPSTNRAVASTTPTPGKTSLARTLFYPYQLKMVESLRELGNTDQFWCPRRPGLHTVLSFIENERIRNTTPSIPDTQENEAIKVPGLHRTRLRRALSALWNAPKLRPGLG